MSDVCKNKPHKWGKWKWDYFTTTEGKALEYRECKRCGHKELRIISICKYT